MSVNLITGNLFSPIQASQDSDYQAGTFGEKTQILNVGSKMAVSIVDNSTIRCENGVLVTKEGRRVQIDNGDVVEWTIPTGTQGTTSYYIVGFRLYTDDESAQLCDTFVQSMPSESATITEDTFRDGAVEIFVSVARVVQNGVTLESVQSLVPLATTLDQAKEDIIRINSDLTDIYGVPLNSDYVQNLPTSSADDAPQGFRKGQNSTGQPSLMNEWVLYHTCYYDSEKLYGWQIAYHMNGYDIAYRYKRNGVWFSWKYVAFTS